MNISLAIKTLLFAIGIVFVAFSMVPLSSSSSSEVYMIGVPVLLLGIGLMVGTLFINSNKS